ncbi:sigma 54-interacting transcriptional regulator [Brevibacillus choshinensis]|uniref:sigma 54-interacting transcriptional regulator n=1 Tax=Brevibacillus choshinensis TaxID=54911 RepID=UPI001EED02CE|nr:sigma 54-interacting transcriptional regulator [Brevibacillus choshinensis]
MLAAAIHSASSQSNGPFIIVNCGDIPECDLPFHLQVKLLHVLQTKQVERVLSNKLLPVNIRVISATNKNLEEMVRNNEFREDLYFRMSVIPLHMPPLRDRSEDILLLMDYFLAKYHQLLNHPILDFTPKVKVMFCHYQ